MSRTIRRENGTGTYCPPPLPPRTRRGNPPTPGGFNRVPPDRRKADGRKAKVSLTMELTDSATLCSFLLFTQPARRRSSPRLPKLRSNTKSSYCAPAAKSKGKRNCRCGHCGDCLENARWERVFQAKFADPNYYGGLRVRNESPLNSV